MRRDPVSGFLFPEENPRKEERRNRYWKPESGNQKPVYEFFRLNRQSVWVARILPQARAMVSNARS